MRTILRKVVPLITIATLSFHNVILPAKAAVDLEEGTANFPPSYQEALQSIQDTHPNWKFIPVDTGLDWDTVIVRESAYRVNTIESNVPNGGIVSQWSVPFSYLSTNADCYDWNTDTYKVVDSTNRYTPNKKVVAYYMDPRNFLTEDRIFQFESLAYEETQDIEIVKSILSDTFMNGTYTYTIKKANGKKVTKTKSYAKTFMTAAKKSGASPYFLATRVRQEVGIYGSDSVSGAVKGYKSIYNFYNIGATDGAGAVTRGLAFAKEGTTYSRPWTNQYKAIVGGAKWIAEGYINVGQNTPYFQKFSVVDSSKLYWHQYMTNIQAPESEASRSYSSYQNCNALDGTIVFRIPIYNNMPESPCVLPKAAGNPNNYIKEVVATNQKGKDITSKLDFTFDYTKKSYTIEVPKSISQITLTATASSRFATLAGNAKTIELDFGETKTVKIKCTSQSGKLKTYSFIFTREESPTDEVITGESSNLIPGNSSDATTTTETSEE